MKETKFKFRNISSNSISSFMHDELFASTPEQFNDPYDSLFYYDVDKLYESFINDDKSLTLLAEFLLDEWKKGRPKTTLCELKEAIKNNKIHFLPCFNNLVLDLLHSLRTQVLISCFCNSNKKAIMWSHYANYGTGFALEYKKEDLSKLANNYITEYANAYKNDYNIEELKVFGYKKVDYNGTRFDGTNVVYCQIQEYLQRKIKEKKRELTEKKYILNLDDFDSLFLYKDKSWNYEDEDRIILPNHNVNKRFKCIGKIKPIAVYLGEFISFNDKYLICSIANVKNIPIFKMLTTLDKKSFGLKTRRLSKPEIDEILNNFTEKN